MTDPIQPDRKRSLRWTPTSITIVCAYLVVSVAGALYYVHATTDWFAPLPPAELDRFNTDNLAVNPRRAMTAPREEGFFDSIVTEHAAGPNRNKRARTAPAADADFLPADARVVGVVVNDRARAYPLAVLTAHEMVNDVLGGVPIAVCFCPLSNSVNVTDRRIDGKTLTFDVSGMLLNSNVVLFDRTHRALWSQVRLTAISGPYSGRSLDHLDDWQITSFADWREQHPGSTVLTFDTGHDRTYDKLSSHYASYLFNDKLWYPVSRHDDRLTPKTRVIGIRTPDKTRAYTLDAIARAGGVLEAAVEGGTVRIAVDEKAERVHVIEAPSYAQVIHTMWFAWYAFHPETELIE